MSDLISRADAMAYPISWESYDKRHGDTKFVCGVESYREYIEHLPSAQPKQGEWIDTSSGEHWKCSACGCRASYFWIDTNRAIEWLSEFCPNCGAKMEVERD